MKSAYQILTEAADLIRDPAHWTQGVNARDRHGAPTGPHNPHAVCWCFAGAIIKCGGGERFESGIALKLQELFKGEAGITHTNDDRGHAAVMTLAERVREKAKALEAAT